MIFELIRNINLPTQYITNLWLIIIFSMSFLFFKQYLKTNLSPEELATRKLQAETYLNKHKNSDLDFFVGNPVEEHNLE
jgi:hypothetical protein